MAEIHHFTYGAFNPLAAFLLAFLGSFFGLLSTARARGARTRGRRNRWLLIGAFAIGGGAIWLMHFAAMLGFEVPASPVRFDVPMTVGSLLFAVFAVGAGLLMVGHGRRNLPKTIMAGVLTGGGVLAMHYTGMLGMRVAGEMRYDVTLVAASAVIAVVASTVALWFTVSVQSWLPIGGAAVIMAIAVCGMHYTGMAAMSVHLDPAAIPGVTGFRPLTMIVPITLITAASILGVALSALQAMTEEEFTDGAGTPRRGVHAEPGNPWSLKQATVATAARRPSPRPVPMRSPTNG
ncbi:MHYT domain-containing protein [Actinoplanes solisilvae]|uniref:MHYT domain-containing protein n=1 Tax=Actinoplanes solisilvae TaxID=2486853 RepID=UPI000FD9FE91|nr:MHYT domain-containing protein [Actinoplanes solisilvae]